jgi:hypothetical protein
VTNENPGDYVTVYDIRRAVREAGRIYHGGTETLRRAIVDLSNEEH